MSSVSWSNTPASIRLAGIAALLGFFVSCSSSRSSTSNGRLVECSYTDFGALMFGAAAIGGGLVGLASIIRADREDKAILVVVAAVSIVVGVVHLLRGVGTIGGPCN